VSALLLGRAVARRHEVGVRLSLGATRFRIVRQVLTESLVYAIAGASLGLALYTITIQIAYATIPGILPGLEARPATFFGAAALALVTTVVFGLAPALHASRAGIGEVIKNSGPQTMRRSRLQAGLVVLQLASSQPVLIVTSLVLIDLRARNGISGTDAPASVVTMQLDLFRAGATRLEPEAAELPASRASLARIQQHLKQLSGVESAAMATGSSSARFETPGETREGGGRAAEMRQTWVTPDYLALSGFQLLQGSTITAAEDRPGSTAIVVNAAAASRLWPEKNPVGNLLLRRPGEPGEPTRVFEVIGVVGSLPQDPNPEVPVVFAPMATAEHIGQPTLIVRTAGDAGPLLPQLKRAIGEIEPWAGVSGGRTLAEIESERRRESLQSNAAALAIGAAALLLASLGLYAIIALAVAQRTREIGVRLAVGATPAAVVRMFLGNGLKVSLIGLAIGVPLTVAGIRLVQAGVVGFSLEKIAAVLLVVPALIGVAGFASWLPARRAGRVDPLVALRTE
jgi:predicted permease